MMIQHLSGRSVGHLPSHLRGVEPHVAVDGGVVHLRSPSASPTSIRGAMPDLVQADEVSAIARRI
jgi:hypothetical protein